MLTFLNVLLIVVKSVGIMAIGAMILIGADLVWYYRKVTKKEFVQIKATADAMKTKLDAAKTMLRREKEEYASGGFFEESYTRGFNDTTGELLYRGLHRAPADDEVWEACQKLNELTDTQIFDNTEDL